MSQVAILGYGPHGRVVAEAAQLMKLEVIGYIDPRVISDAALARLGGNEIIPTLAARGVRFICAVGSLGDPKTRQDLVRRVIDAGGAFTAVVHPSAVISPAARIEQGAFVGPGAVVNFGAWIGAHAIVNTRVVVEHDCRVGEFCHLAPGTILCGAVSVEAGAHLGPGSVAVQNVTIGSGARVGAGSVVLDDVRPGGKVLGVPARETMEVFETGQAEV